MKKAGEAKRLTLLAAMVQTLRISARDEVSSRGGSRLNDHPAIRAAAAGVTRA